MLSGGGSFFFFFLAVVDVVTLGGLEFVKVGEAGCYKNVVPLQQFLDVAVVYAVAVPLGQHAGEVVVQLLGAGLLVVDAGRLAALQLLDGVEHFIEGNVLGLGKHGDVGQRGESVGGECRYALVRFVECFYDEAVLCPRYELVKSRFARDS